MYYVGFSSCTIVASLILFQGFNTTDGTNTVSLLAGFTVTFLGVHLLNLSRVPEHAGPMLDGHSSLENGLMNPRMSLSGRMSLDGWNMNGEAHTPNQLNSAGHGRRSSLYRAQSTTLFNAFTEDEEDRQQNEVALHDLVHEEDDEDDEVDERTHLQERPGQPRSHNGSGSMQGTARSSPRPL